MSRGKVLAAMVAGLLLMLASLHRATPRLVWNASASVPPGLYQIVPGPVRPGDLALVRLPPNIAVLADRRRYLPKSAYLIKLVFAVGGEHVCRLGDRVIARGTTVVRALRRDSHGRRMPAWHGCRRLAAGDLFVLGNDPHSFDSRYFGAVSATNLVGRAVLVWSVREPR
jgi:conjugative transfer signal peptidase TraF